INRDLIFQMIYNLIHNAIRYNKHEGNIRISEQLNKDGSCLIRIEDNGIGIPKEEVSTLFNRFKKVGSTGESGAYGLGLSIVKSIADYHNIQIKIHSVPGEGTSFTLRFPAELIQ